VSRTFLIFCGEPPIEFGPTNPILSDKQTLNTSNTLAGNATKKVNKLGLQLFEQQTKLNSLLDLGNSLNQSTMLLDQLSLAVDDLKSSQPNVSEIMNEVNGFRREFHAKHQEEAEFRDATNKKSQVMFNELVRLTLSLEPPSTPRVS